MLGSHGTWFKKRLFGICHPLEPTSGMSSTEAVSVSRLHCLSILIITVLNVSASVHVTPSGYATRCVSTSVFVFPKKPVCSTVHSISSPVSSMDTSVPVGIRNEPFINALAFPALSATSALYVITNSPSAAAWFRFKKAFTALSTWRMDWPLSSDWCRRASGSTFILFAEPCMPFSFSRMSIWTSPSPSPSPFFPASAARFLYSSISLASRAS
mmetsp:Transcript_6896/g.16020  ORF Transcript_6896/g.16020 Transcript_6896/m.16020 type:complete len:213 (-) Transcript_6896:426-1064(-)